jgi:hypothetical protein
LQQQESPESVLRIAGDELDLGRVWETSRYEHTIHITNLLDRPVTIAGFAKTCDCLEISPTEGVLIQPHESKSFTLHLSLVSRSEVTRPRDGEAFQVGLSARYSDDRQVQGTTSWRLYGVIAPTLRFAPGVLQIGTRSEREALIGPALRIEANDSIDVIHAEAPPGWSVIVSRDQESPAGPFRAVVRRREEAKPGRVADVIRFTPVDHDGQRLPAKELKIVGEIVPDVVAHPQEIHHGRQRCGATAEETLRIVSLTNRPFQVTKASSGSADLEVNRVADKDGGWLYSLRVRFSATGEQEARVRFTIREEDAKESEVTVPVRYQGFRSPD